MHAHGSETFKVEMEQDELQIIPVEDEEAYLRGDGGVTHYFRVSAGRKETLCLSRRRVREAIELCGEHFMDFSQFRNICTELGIEIGEP